MRASRRSRRAMETAGILLAVLSWLLHFAQVAHFVGTPHVHVATASGGETMHAVGLGCSCGHHTTPRDANGPRSARAERDGDVGGTAVDASGAGDHHCGWIPPSLSPCHPVDVRSVRAPTAIRGPAGLSRTARRVEDRLTLAPKHGPPASS